MSTEVARSSSSTAANASVDLERQRDTTLQHDVGAGAPCLKCGDDCPGLELHFWRKICMQCHCRRDEHDIRSIYDIDPGHIRIGRLFDHIANEPLWTNDEEQLRRRMQDANVGGGANSHNSHGRVPPPVAPKTKLPISPGSGGDNDAVAAPSVMEQQQIQSRLARRDNPSLKVYDWIPDGTEVHMVHKYFEALNPEDRPIKGGEGETRRHLALERQLPMHDCDAEHMKTELTIEERKQMDAYVANVKRKTVGQGQVAEVGVNTRQSPVGCQSCDGSMPKGDAAVMTKHDPSQTWHPNCFRCCECKELLVDMLYFHRDGKYYCGRHFADSMFPRCRGCDELIFAREYTRAEDRDWHVNHFCCFGCDKELGGHRYMVKNDHQYCVQCYLTKFAKMCQTCNQKIAPDTERISHSDFNWHATPQCFGCEQCQISLVGKKFVIKNQLVFCGTECKDDYKKQQRKEKRAAR